MTTERIKEILTEYGIENTCAVVSEKKERCGWKKCIKCNMYEDERNAVKQATNEAIYETLNECSSYITKERSAEIAERLKVK